MLFLPLQFLFLSLSCLVSSVRADCYYPNGSNATDYTYVPCKGGSGFSPCCIPSEGDVCLSNGMCWYNHRSYPFRGACTDKSWKSTACPTWCVANTPDSYQSLTSCGGTKYCCSDTSGCCSKPYLVFDIGVPSVVNNYGSSQTISTLVDQPTTGQKTTITIATTGTDSVATSGTLAAVTMTHSVGLTMTNASQATSTSASFQATSTTSHKGLIIGAAAGVAVLFVLAVITGVLLCCVLKKRRAREARPVSLIDMNTPIQRQQVNNGPNPHWVHKPGTKHGAYGPEKPAWDPVPAYIPPYWQQQQPVNGHGQTLIELQSPAVQQRPPGGPVYEIH